MSKEGIKRESLPAPPSRLFVVCLMCAGIFSLTVQAQEAAPPAACEGTRMPAAASGTANSLAMPAVSPTLVRDLNVVRDASFPELQSKAVKSRTFESSTDYFRTRFSVTRFFLWLPMHYFVEVNPRIENSGPPAESTCAILAHELVHLSRMSHGNRLHLFGLVRLASASYTARFERSTDLEAIRRGYGPGLVTFREWVYKNIPAKALDRKKRNYFSPEEIAAILLLTKTQPDLFAYWNNHVPMNLEQIQQAGNRTH